MFRFNEFSFVSCCFGSPDRLVAAFSLLFSASFCRWKTLARQNQHRCLRVAQVSATQWGVKFYIHLFEILLQSAHVQIFKTRKFILIFHVDRRTVWVWRARFLVINAFMCDWTICFHFVVQFPYENEQMNPMWARKIVIVIVIIIVWILNESNWRRETFQMCVRRPSIERNWISHCRRRLNGNFHCSLYLNRNRFFVIENEENFTVLASISASQSQFSCKFPIRSFWIVTESREFDCENCYALSLLISMQTIWPKFNVKYLMQLGY